MIPSNSNWPISRSAYGLMASSETVIVAHQAHQAQRLGALSESADEGGVADQRGDAVVAPAGDVVAQLIVEAGDRAGPALRLSGLEVWSAMSAYLSDPAHRGVRQATGPPWHNGLAQAKGSNSWIAVSELSRSSAVMTLTGYRRRWSM